MASEDKWSMLMELGSMKTRQSLCVILAFLGSNFLSLYVGVSWHTLNNYGPPTHNPSPISISSLFNTLSSDLNLTQVELHLTRLELSQLKQDLKASQDLSKILLASGCFSNPSNVLPDNYAGNGAETTTMAAVKSSSALPRVSAESNEPREYTNSGAVFPRVYAESDELREYTSTRKLPLGWSSGMAALTMVSPIGNSCGSEANREDLKKYMKYEVGGECPDDQGLAHTLTVHGCEPLPRRRCFAKGPPHFKEPLPLPESLWSTPSDDSILWSPYTCKSFECLNERKKKRVFEDCIDCFELQGREKQRWTKHASELDYSIDEILLLKPGSIRIGLDIGGGTGTFAVRMREKNVTIVTTSLNLNGPFNNFIAMRGVVPLFLTIAQRLPFFDNTLDIVHSMHVLSNWIPNQTLEFLLFDIDRVLRPGGLFWLDHFFCIQQQLDDIYLPLIEKLGYQKLRWGVGPKLDRGPELQEVYLSAILEKPLTRN